MAHFTFKDKMKIISLEQYDSIIIVCDGNRILKEKKKGKKKKQMPEKTQTIKDFSLVIIAVFGR